MGKKSCQGRKQATLRHFILMKSLKMVGNIKGPTASNQDLKGKLYLIQVFQASLN